MNQKKQINSIVGQNIKREREKAGYTQERFSELIGIGPKSLSAIERGIDMAMLLCPARINSVRQKLGKYNWAICDISQ